MRDPGESPDRFLIVKQRSWPNVRRRGPYAWRVRIRTRALPRGRNTVWGDLRRLREDLEWLGSRGCPVRLAPSGQGTLKAVTDRVGSDSRDNISRPAATRYPCPTDSRARRDVTRVAFFAWLFRWLKAFERRCN